MRRRGLIGLGIGLAWPAWGETLVALTKKGGTFEVPVELNGVVTAPFKVDSGASDVSIPEGVVARLRAAGALGEGDMLDDHGYRIADGSRVTKRRFRLRTVRVGDRTIEGVVASVAPAKADGLLGQSFLSRFHRVGFDYDRGALFLD